MKGKASCSYKYYLGKIPSDNVSLSEKIAKQVVDFAQNPCAQWSSDDLKEEVTRVYEIHRCLTANLNLISEVLRFRGTSCHLYPGGNHPQYGEGIVCPDDRLATLPFLLVSKNCQAYVYESLRKGHTTVQRAPKLLQAFQPRSTSAIVAIASAIANPIVSAAQGLEPSDPQRQMQDKSPTGEPLLMKFKEFYQQGERVTSYIGGKRITDEYRWGIIDALSGKIISQPGVYRACDTRNDMHIGFLKEDDLLITILERNRGGPIIFAYGAHVAGTKAITHVFANKPLLEEILKNRPTHGNFQVHVRVTSVIPDHKRRIMTIPENALELADIRPVKRTDERLSGVFSSASDVPPRIFDDKITMRRAFSSHANANDVNVLIP